MEKGIEKLLEHRLRWIENNHIEVLSKHGIDIGKIENSEVFKGLKEVHENLISPLEDLRKLKELDKSNVAKIKEILDKIKSIEKGEHSERRELERLSEGELKILKNTKSAFVSYRENIQKGSLPHEILYDFGIGVKKAVEIVDSSSGDFLEALNEYKEFIEKEFIEIEGVVEVINKEINALSRVNEKINGYVSEINNLNKKIGKVKEEIASEEELFKKLYEELREKVKEIREEEKHAKSREENIMLNKEGKAIKYSEELVKALEEICGRLYKDLELMIKLHENLSKSLNEVAGVLRGKRSSKRTLDNLALNIKSVRNQISSSLSSLENQVNHNKQVIRYAGYIVLSRIKKYCEELIDIEKKTKEIEKQGAEAS